MPEDAIRHDLDTPRQTYFQLLRGPAVRLLADHLATFRRIPVRGFALLPGHKLFSRGIPVVGFVDVSQQWQQGGTFSLLGPNGAGE